VAGQSKLCAQKIHNQMAGLSQCSKGSQYVHFVDVNCQLHPGTIGEMVTELENSPNVFVATGFPLDIPPPSASMWTWAICQFRYVSSLASFNSSRFKAVWGGSMMLRKSDLDNNVNSIYTRLLTGAFSDDGVVDGAAQDHGNEIATPLSCLFPNQLKADTTFPQVWNFVRRQLSNLRTYSSVKSGIRSHVLLVACVLYSSTMCVGCVLTVVGLAFACIWPETVTLYPVYMTLSILWAAGLFAFAWAQRKLVFEAHATCGILSPKRKIESADHLYYWRFVQSALLGSLFIFLGGVASFFLSSVNWGGILYVVQWGKVVEVIHPGTGKAEKASECKGRNMLRTVKKFGVLAMSAMAMMTLNIIWG